VSVKIGSRDVREGEKNKNEDGWAHIYTSVLGWKRKALLLYATDQTRFANAEMILIQRLNGTKGILYKILTTSARELIRILERSESDLNSVSRIMAI
jgi:hypothetical protein